LKCGQKLNQVGGFEIIDPDEVTVEELRKRQRPRKEFIHFKEYEKYVQDDPVRVSKIPDHMLKALFKNFPPVPKPIILDMMVNMEGLYSITRKTTVWRIEEICQDLLGVPNLIDKTIVIGTAGIGGEVMNLVNRVKHTWAYEYSPVQYSMLVNNIDLILRYHNGEPSENYTVDEKYYSNHNVELFNDDFTLNVDKHDGDIMIVDPPWGGLSYKQKSHIVLKLCDICMIQIVNRSNCSVYLFKLPFNHNLKMFQELEPTFKVVFYKMKKYIIVALKRN